MIVSTNTTCKHYKANVTAGALLVSESRKIADLLLSGVDKNNWKDAVENKNILQKRSLASAKRIAVLIRSRLGLMDNGLWAMIVKGDSTLATHATFAAAIKHCILLGDYLDSVVRDQFQRLEDRIPKRCWDEYIVQCAQRDPLMKDFPPSTARKVRSNIHKILVEAGYLHDSRTLILQRVEIEQQVLNYLRNRNEDYVLRCIQV